MSRLCVKACELCKTQITLLKLNRYIKTTDNKLTAPADLTLGYVPSDIEERLQDDNNYFTPKIKEIKSFSMILPPPNITGDLHLGHALTATIQDVIIRWKRMQGIETVWIPGIDHAGIATQVVVEKRLWKENRQTRHDIGRELFENEVWRWKQEKADMIGKQLERLGLSLDWSKKVFTMDEKRCRAVTKAFIKLFDDGLIYRANYLVNWSCILQSAISDVEVDYVEINGPTDVSVPGYEDPVKFGTMTYFAYKLADSDEEIVIGTTRPETVLGDVAVAVNPRDSRYTHFVGRNLWHPFRKQTIPIICDDLVEPDFGTGALKVTPAHDNTDFEISKKHGLNILQVINENGKISSICEKFSGIRRFDARNIIISELERLHLLRDTRDHSMIIPICSRSKDIVELLIKPQWFVKCSEMARKAIEDVQIGELTIEPKLFQRNWFNWLENIRDWCISRQLWWGHRIPAFYCYVKDQPEKHVWIAAENQEIALQKAAKHLICTTYNVKDNIIAEQDQDVLDTWFSSALQPFSAFEWPQQNSDLLKFYPLSLMATGHDILFFWVARMVMLGNYLTGTNPFKKILLHGILCDVHGKKMSKSLGNVISPNDIINGTTLQEMELNSKASHDAGILSGQELKRAIQGHKKMFPQGIQQCGADALRFTLCSHNIKNHFINFNADECYVNKLFGNKIWQATKFTNMWMKKVSEQQILKPILKENFSLMDRWILSRLYEMIEIVNNSMNNYDLHVATAAIKNFLYYEFCNVYLEATKRGLRETSSQIAAGHCWSLICSLDTALKCLAPFMPRLAYHLHKHLLQYPGEERTIGFPQNQYQWRDKELEKSFEIVFHTIIGIRRLKKLFSVTAKHMPEVYIVSKHSVHEEFSNVIGDLSACPKVNIVNEMDQNIIKNTVKDNIGEFTSIYLVVPSELRDAIELDLPKLEIKRIKLIKELEKMNKMISGSNYHVKATLGAKEHHKKKVTLLKENLERIDNLKSIVK